MLSHAVRAGLLASATAAVLVHVSPLSAQGCEPIRFTTPVSLGGKGEAYQREQQWRFTIAYRGLRANQWFVGSTQADSRGPGGQPTVFNINTYVGDVAYAASDRLLLRVSVPFLTGTSSAKRADGVVHAQSATGIGDVSVLAETWLFAPKTHESGNFSIGLGVKAPTGSHTSPSQFWTATGAVDFPADQTIQPGDGGWALLTQAQGFHQFGKYAYLYANGSYVVSPKAQSDVVFSPGSTLHWSVPDTYSASVGAAVSVLPDQGLSLSLGGRMDGIPRHDLIGGGDDNTVKRTSQVGFVEPGVNWSRGKDSFTLSIPVRVYVNRFKSDYEVKTNGLNGGGFAKYLVFASYSHRL